MRLYKLSGKLVIRVSPKAADFLKAYSSNTPDKPRNAFLDLKGKIVVIFDQVLVDQDVALIVIESQFVDRLKMHLKTYLFLMGITLEPLNLLVFHDLAGDSDVKIGEFSVPQSRGRLILTKDPRVCDVNEESYTLFRLKNNLPVQGVDFDEELLLNVGDEEFISYSKGCYLGQEIIARVHHKSKPPKKLVVSYENSFSPEEIPRMTSLTFDPDRASRAGFHFIQNP